jgi:hypothetical protein
MFESGETLLFQIQFPAFLCKLAGAAAENCAAIAKATTLDAVAFADRATIPDLQRKQ